MRDRMAAGVVAGLGRADQGQAILTRDLHQHGVEQIAGDGVGQRQVGGGDLDEDRLEALGRRPDGGMGGGGILEREVVVEQGVQRADADHVVVEGAAGDGGAGLLGQDRARGRVAAGDGLGGLTRLAGGVRAVPDLMRVAAPDQQVDAGRSVLGAQADMVGGPLVGQMSDGGQGVVDGEAGGVGEQGVQRIGGRAGDHRGRPRHHVIAASVLWALARSRR